LAVEEQEQFFFPHYERDLHDPFLFTSMRAVVDRIKRAKDSGEKVGVFGDYDADGVTSSVILRTGLEALGLAVSVYIPDKNLEGHGLHRNAIEAFAQAGVTLAFTVDCGMTNHAEILEAKERDIEFIVIDHHHVPEVLPEAIAIVNPKLPGAGYPFAELCGAGTTFKVVQALYQELLPEALPQLKWLLDVVAIGTVADVMPLIGENRTLVHFGLIVLGKTKRIGLQELFAVGRIPIDDNHPATAWSIGFQVAPRINATSRMAHAMQAHKLLMTTDRVEARDLALEIESHNVERRKVSDYITTQVRKVAQEATDKKLIFAVDEQFAFGVVGLVAGRIANEFGKPTVVLQRGEEVSQGSLRSVPTVNIIEAIEECGDLLVKFGGHAQAAGLTVKNENLEVFHERFEQAVARRLDGVMPEAELLIDARVSPYLLTLELLRDLQRMAPFGQGNPEPTFLVENMLVREARMVGTGNKHLKLTLSAEDGGAIRRGGWDAIAFGLGERFPDLKPNDRLDLVVQLDANTWNGSTKLQFKVVDMRRSG
jgi:single-stranded-DNA-specific exonuclease